MFRFLTIHTCNNIMAEKRILLKATDDIAISKLNNGLLQTLLLPEQLQISVTMIAPELYCL